MSIEPSVNYPSHVTISAHLRRRPLCIPTDMLRFAWISTPDPSLKSVEGKALFVFSFGGLGRLAACRVPAALFLVGNRLTQGFRVVCNMAKWRPVRFSGAQCTERECILITRPALSSVCAELAPLFGLRITHGDTSFAVCFGPLYTISFDRGMRRAENATAVCMHYRYRSPSGVSSHHSISRQIVNCDICLHRELLQLQQIFK